MKIRLINEQDWQKIYDFDKSIVRVGSQMNCDVQIKGKDIKPLVLQIVRSGEHDPRFVMRTFDDNVSLSRGDQVFACQAVTPQLLMDGDTVSFNTFRMIINLEDEHTRTRTSPHIEAEMFLQKRELQPDMPINGALKLKNLGTEKACQFRMSISGIPKECLKSSPLPLLYPGGEGTVGFMITHLQTRPEPGFHTVSISVSAPEEYFGEALEFNQDIYVVPFFENEIILEDDSDIMDGGSKPVSDKAAAEEKKPAESETLSEPARMDLNQRAYEREETPIDRASAVVYKKDSQKEAFSDEDSESDRRRPTRRKKEKVVVIHRDDQKDGNIFDEEPDDVSPAESENGKQEDVKPAAGIETDKRSGKEKAGAAEIKKSEPETIKNAGEPEPKKSAPAKKIKTLKHKEHPAEAEPAERNEKPASKESAPVVEDVVKKTAPDIIPEPIREEPVKNAAEPAETVDVKAAEASPALVLFEIQDAAEPSPETPAADALPAEAEPAAKPAEKPLFEIGSAAAGKTAEAEPVPAPEASADAVPEVSAVPDDAEKPGEEEPEVRTDAVPEISAVPDDGETPKEKEPEGAEKPEKPAVIAANIPVIRSNELMDFDDADIPAPAPEPEKKAKVVVMKGGKFDE